MSQSDIMGRKILASSEKVIHVAGMVIVSIGAIILASMMLLTVVDVFLRYFFNRPILGSTEITQLMLVTLSFLMLVFCTMRRSHVKVDILAERLPGTVQIILDTVFLFLSLVLFFCMSWYGFLEAQSMRIATQATDILEIPVHPFYYTIAVTSAIVCLLLLIYILKNIFKLLEK